MPELPEVETITNDLKHTVVGAEIVGFWSNSPAQVVPNINSVRQAVVGKKITSAQRRAKLMLLEIGPSFLGIHLKMTGRLLFKKQKDPTDKYCHVIFTLKKSNTKDLLELRFCDVRKFGYIRLFKNKEELKSVVENKLGPEPFSQKFTVGYLEKVLAKKNVAIKTVIMDQTLVSGIGNIYSNEALFLAGISPTKKASILGYKEIRILRDSIRNVLKKGIKYRGSSAKDESYRDLYGELGQYQNHFLVYEQKGKQCQKCQSVIEYQKVNGRGTFWCPKCQK